MAKKSVGGILRHHLEYLSGEVFEQYPEVVRELIRGRSGVYALYRGDRLYYVGLATNLMTRVKHHFKDRHQRRWDHFSVYLTADSEHIRELESLLLRIANPPGNQIVGRLGKSGDLHDDFERRAQELEAARRSRLLGARRGSKGRKAPKGPKQSKGGIQLQRGRRPVARFLSCCGEHTKARSSRRFCGRMERSSSGTRSIHHPQVRPAQ